MVGGSPRRGDEGWEGRVEEEGSGVSMVLVLSSSLLSVGPPRQMLSTVLQRGVGW